MKLSAQTRSLGKITKRLQASVRSHTGQELSQGNKPSGKKFCIVKGKKDSSLLSQKLVGQSQQANKDFTKASDDICSRLMQLTPYKDSLCRSKNKTKSLRRFLDNHSQPNEDHIFADRNMRLVHTETATTQSKKPVATKLVTRERTTFEREKEYLTPEKYSIERLLLINQADKKKLFSPEENIKDICFSCRFIA